MTAPSTATNKLQRLKPVTPTPPTTPIRRPPTNAPTTPSARFMRRPEPRPCMILLAIQPARSPSIIQAMKPITNSPSRSAQSAATDQLGPVIENGENTVLLLGFERHDCACNPEIAEAPDLMERHKHALSGQPEHSLSLQTDAATADQVAPFLGQLRFERPPTQCGR